MIATLYGFTFRLKAFFIGLLISIAVFSTTYSINGFFIYPRFLIALLGVLFVIRSRKQFRFIFPVSASIIIILITTTISVIHSEWRHFPAVIGFIIRGIVIPYFAAHLALQFLISAVLNAKSEYRWRFLILTLFSAIAIQAGLALIQLLNTEFRSDFINLVNLEEGWREMAALGLPRFTGIGGISIYDTSLSYCLFGSIFLFNKRYRADGLWLNSALIVVLILLCVLHGRTGLLFMLALVSLIAFQEFKLMLTSPSVLLRIFILIFGISFLLYLYIAPDDIGYILSESGELFYNFFSGKGFRTDSTDELIDNYLIWPSYQAIFLGSAVWAQPDLAIQLNYSYSTDSGYLLLLNYGGLLYLLIFCFTLFFIIYQFCKTSYDGLNQIFKIESSLIFKYIFFILFFTSIKGPLFLSEHFMTALFLILGVVFRLGKLIK